MSLSLDEARALCTKSELQLVAESRSPAIEKLSVIELKKNVANVRKLTEKWQKLSRGQSRNESQKSGEPNLDSRSYSKHQLFQETLAAYEGQLAKAPPPATDAGNSPTTSKRPTAKQRNATAKSSRQAVKKELNVVKKGLNKSATAPAVPAAAAKATKPAAKATPAAKSKVTVSKPAAKAAAAKKTLLKSADKRAKKRATLASSAPVPAKKKVAKVTAKAGIVIPTAAAQAELAGKAKANRMKLSNLNSNIAGHVSGAGKRRQAKRDAKGR